MPVKVKTIAREAAQEALVTSLRQVITAQLAAELTRAFSEAPVRDELARVVREAVADAIAGIDLGMAVPVSGSPGSRALSEQ